MRRVIVDIDNTLWDFASVFYAHLKEIHPEIPQQLYWERWDYLKRFVTDKELYGVLRKIHMKQDTVLPFPDARFFLSSLKDMGCSITIASHREKGSFEPTERWLINHHLPYDELHVSFDKSVLFSQSWAVVDDSPIVLSKARNAGIIGTGLRYPWNEREDHVLFDSLKGILSYLGEQF